MIAIQPYIPPVLTCPCCRADKVHSTSVLFQGIYTLAECTCTACGSDFYHTLPVGHARSFPVAFTRDFRRESYPESSRGWFAQPLIRSLAQPQPVHPAIGREILADAENVVLLNCLDSCYGHVFLRLLNAQQHLTAGDRLIVLIPKNFRWMVPPGVAEVWWVDAPLSQLGKWIAPLDAFIREQLGRFSRVALSPAYIHPDTTRIDFRPFLKQPKFDLSEFAALTPQITFICREDRYWVATRLEEVLMLACVKFRLLKYARGYFVRRQNQLINRTAKRIAQELGEVRFAAVGIGKTGRLSAAIADHRTEEVTDATEQEWCSLYAGSHVVIGIHGSNMLIPTALAAGFIELLPRHKIPHLTEDIAAVHTNRYAAFLGRFLDQFTSTRLLARHAVSLIRDFPFLYRNTEESLSAPASSRTLKN